MKIFIDIKKWQIFLQLSLFVCVFFAFSLVVIKDFYNPISGSGDIESWEYIGFYFQKNISFTPFPQLNLINNEVFYPYGVNNVFQTWGLERDIFYSIFYSLLGIGPWLKIYYLLTLLITALGSFLLLVKDYGVARATGIGFLVSFFNFYAIFKFPYHFNISVVHWTTLNLIVDFLLVKKVFFRQQVSLIFLLIKGLLLLLSLGQDVGYIAGLALMSFLISGLFIATLSIYRVKREQKISETIKKLFQAYKLEFLAHPWIGSVLLMMSIGIGFIYIPLLLQIFREVKQFDFFDMAPTEAWWNSSLFKPILRLFNLTPGQGVWWANPLRLLIPFLPGFNSAQPWVEKLFKDSPEALGAGSPGWFLLIIGIAGLWQARKRIAIFVPLLSVLILCILYHPKYFPILKIFPWFSYYRVAGRSTVIYAVILSIFALGINLNQLHSWKKKIVAALLVCLACTELFTAYSFKVFYNPSLDESSLVSEHILYQPYSFDKNFFTYMNYVKEQPGEAVLDWPFCAAGTNAVGIKIPPNQNLCPYLESTMLYALRRFHEKKVVGQLFSRLHPSQIEPYLQAGWDKLLAVDDKNLDGSKRPRQCFKPDEWAFFTDFYKFNDFAGINLYVDLLPEICVTEFHQRFGKPVIETVVPQAGRVQFIPKSSELRSQVNPALGVSLKFKPSGN